MARRRDRAMEEDGLPPLEVMPQTNPVAALKNQTALSNKFTPEAAKDLYGTATRVNYKNDEESRRLGHYVMDMGPLGNALGEALGAKPPYEISIDKFASPRQAQETLVHEYAHKYHDQGMPFAMYEGWNRFSPILASDYAKERVSRDYEGNAGPSGGELYATATEQGAHNIPEQLRSFYPFYREDAFTPPPAPPAPAAPMQRYQGPDLAALRQQYFSPQQWVPEQGVAGYWANGEPMSPPDNAAYPGWDRWNPPVDVQRLQQSPYYRIFGPSG